MTEKLRLATRGSRLALAQANHVAERLRAGPARPEVEIVVMTTKGDRIQDVPLPEIGGKGLFTAELEEALRNGEVDLAVHSLKDLPTELPDGLDLGAVPAREDPRDVLATREPAASLDDLPRGAKVGTSSLRRAAQLLALRDDLRIESIRGNVDTRLRKVAEGVVDAACLAMAGLRRLGLAEHARVALDPETFVPAPGQGLLGIETRAGDARVIGLLAPIEDAGARRVAIAERGLLAALGGGCRVPIAAFARAAEGDDDARGPLRLRALVGSSDGARIIRAEGTGDDPAALGASVAEELLSRGARELLDAE